MWRFGYENPADYNDNQGFCGGAQHQHEVNGGKCGICGDPYDALTKDHEAPDGKYANGIIVGEFQDGDIIDVTIEITANHKGYLVFKLCPNDNILLDPLQDCFDNMPLYVYPNNEDKYYLPDDLEREYQLKLKLPDGLTCEQCILQWTYVTGNNWGVGEDGKGCTGCGPQENFRACSDIRITGEGNEEEHPIEPSTEGQVPTEQTTEKIEEVTTEKVIEEEEDEVVVDDCVALAPHDKISGMQKWCQDNCKLGNCPETHCQCK